MRLNRLFRVLSTVVLSAAAATASAADWPGKSVRVIIPYTTGGVSDVIGRAIADRMGATLGVPFVVENRGGAGGTIGIAELAKAPADGNTLAFSAVSPLSLSPLFNQVPYQFGDIQPVAEVMVSPVVLLGTPSFKGKSLDDVISQAKKDPGSLRWATSGPGSLGHLMLEQFQKAAKVEVNHIPYKGSGQQLNDALGGQFELASMNVSPTLTSHIQAGKLRPLAIAAPSRLDSMPDVPTFTERGMEKANMMSVFGFFAPAGLPPETLARINAAVNQAVKAPEVQKLLVESNNIPVTGTAEAFAAELKKELDANQALVKAVGLKAN